MKRFSTIDDLKRAFFPRLVERERQDAITVEQRAGELAERLVKKFRRQLKEALA